MKGGLFALACVAATAASARAAPKPANKTTTGATTAACKITPLAPLDVLVAKAPLSTVVALASSKECRDDLVKHTRLTFTSSNSHVLAKPVAGAGTNELQLVFENVDTPIGVRDWTVSSVDSPDLAAATTMSLEVVGFETRSLVLSFFAIRDSRRQSERKAPDLIAAARLSESWDTAPIITNTANIQVSDRLIAPGDYHWRVVDSTWGGSVAFYCLGPGKFHLTVLSSKTACHVRADRLMFGVRRRLKSALVVELQLWDESGAGKLLVRTFIQIASEARVESLPIPLWRVAKVTCLSERLLRDPFTTTADASQTLAVDNDAVSGGNCHLSVDFSFNPVSHPKEKDTAAIDREMSSCEQWNEQLALAGPQNIELTVKRGDTSITKQFQVDPPSAARCEKKRVPDDGITIMSIETPKPAASKKGTPKKQRDEPLDGDFSIPVPSPQTDAKGDYLVSLKLKGSSEVHYFDGSLDEANIDSNTDANAKFVLRPRGPFSTTYPVRFSVTLAVTPVSLRLPARERDITSSSSPTNAHLEGPRTALLGVLELWDHRRNENKLPIPVQLQGGLSLLRLDEKPLDLNTLLGITAAFPFAGEGRTETSISLGFFWEHELFGTHSDAVLFTASLDLFKLAVAKPTSSEAK